ncbi:hypothetical protein FOZ62_030840 [Perkinsus olseni]|uniref:Uncharacterized protein n=2 Tax=Perkinsus olseni TaxID=32597 RepID=A0A7J6RIS2_PEROL|nr:hypothetical protein FOZ62_030840 [Perkinsus olseni]
MLIRAFMRRPPSAIRDADYRNHQEVLARAASSLQVRLEKLKREEAKLDTLREFRKKRKEASLKRDFNKSKADVHMLEDAFSHAHSVVNRTRGENSSLIRVGKLALGIISMILSILWLLHVALYMLARKKGTGDPVSPMLNWLLTDFVHSDSLFIVTFLVFGILVFYLQAATITGCITFGTKLFFIVPVHLLRSGDTPLNSLLFNASLILLSTAATVHFATVALADYTKQSVAWRMFATEVHYLDFYRFFFDNKIFLYMMIISSVIGFIMLTVNGRVKTTSLYVDKSAEKRIRDLASSASGQHDEGC